MKRQMTPSDNGVRAEIAGIGGMAEEDEKKDGGTAVAGGKLDFPSLDNSPLWKDEQLPAHAPAQPPARDEVPPMDIVREHFPRIAKTIEMTWGSRELEDYLARLVISDRADRAGFPPVVLNALLKISRQHAHEFNFGDDAKPGIDPFSHNAFRKR